MVYTYLFSSFFEMTLDDGVSVMGTWVLAKRPTVVAGWTLRLQRYSEARHAEPSR